MKKHLKKKVAVVAIDPDLRKSGVAFVGAEGKVIHLASLTVSDVVELLRDPEFRNKTWAVEDVNRTGAMFNHSKLDSEGTKSRKARNVGMVQGAGHILCDLIESHTGNQPILAPTGIGRQVKRNAKLFKELTGWEGRSNEDTRDAAAIGIWVAHEMQKQITNKKLY